MPRTWARFSGGNLFTVRVLDLLCLVSSTLLLYEFVGLSRGGCSRIYRQDGGNGPLTFQVLTYMSIRGEIQSRIWEGELFKVERQVLSDPAPRAVVVSAEINGLIQGPWRDEKQEEAWGRLRADMESFITGAPISIAKNPRKAKSAFLSRLEGERGQIWEMRHRWPKPGIRLIGGLSEKNVFVALQWALRVDLGAFGSREWRDAIEACKAEWRRKFLTWPPVSGATYEEYLSQPFLLV